jgi:hypothetical protein
MGINVVSAMGVFADAIGNNDQSTKLYTNDNRLDNKNPT